MEINKDPKSLFHIFLLILVFICPLSLSANETKKEEALITQTVTLEAASRDFDDNEVEYIPDEPLPFLGWESRICFVVDEYPAPIAKHVKYVDEMKKEYVDSPSMNPSIYIFGWYGKSLIQGAIKDERGFEYSLEAGMFKKLEIENELSQEVEKHLCTYVSCLPALDGKEPKTIASIKFKAVNLFNANKTYWYTDNSPISDISGKGEYNGKTSHCGSRLDKAIWKKENYGNVFCKNNKNLKLAELCRYGRTSIP